MRKINPKVIWVMTIIITIILGGVTIGKVISPGDDPAEPTLPPGPDDTGTG